MSVLKYWDTGTSSWQVAIVGAEGATGPTGATGAGATGPTGATGSGTGTANKIFNGTSYANIATSNGNLAIGIGNNTWTFDSTGNLNVPGNIIGTANANFTIYSNASVHEFTFGDDGTFYAPDNVVLGGTSITIGPGANSLTGFSNAVLVASSNSNAHVQAVVTNVSDVGSADWIAYGHHGTDAGGWADMGFTSSGFNDANFTITKPGSGFVFAHGFDIATQPVVAGDGSLVLATGEQGNVKDIIFATGGFLEANEFMRISDSNNSLKLTRANASITFPDSTVQTTAYTGGGNTGNVTFSDQVVMGTGSNDGTGGLYLAPGNASIANSAVQYLRVRGGDVATHIHLDTGNNAYYDQYFGADSRFVKLEANGNVVINADDYAGNYDSWTFDTTGNLTVPGSLINETTIVLSAPAIFNICTIATAGSGYNTGSSLKATTGGSGTGMTVGIGYGLSNQLTSVSVVNPGTGYVNGDVITVSEGTGGTFVITKYNVSANQTNNNTVQTNLTFANNTLTLPIYGEIASNANMTLTTNYSNAGNTTSWTFGADGSLTLPIGVSIDYNGNVEYPKIIANSGKLFSVQGQGNSGSAALAWSVNPNAASQYAAVAVSRAGGDNLAKVILTAQANSGDSANAKTWQFNETGNLTLPGNLVIAGNTSVFGTDAALIQTTDNRPLLALSSGANGAVSSLWVEDIGNVGTSNIAAVYANPTSGSKIVRIAVGQNGGGGPNLWDFGATGNLTLPGNTVAINFANGSSAFGNIVATNLDGNVSNLLTGNGTYVAIPTVPTVGNIATLNLDGSNTNILYGNGTFAAVPAPTVTQDITSNGNMSIMLYDGNIKYSNNATVEPSSGNIAGNNISATGNISGNNISATGNISGNTNGFTIGYLNIPQVAAANATLALTDAGKHYYSTTAGNFTLTVPTNANVAFDTGTAVSIVVQAAGNILVNATSGVTLYMAGNSTAANRVVGGYGMATLMKVGTDTWFINGTGVA